MARMTNWNEREMLSSTLRQFRFITGESIGVVHTWRGKLSTVGSENFQHLIKSLKDDISVSIIGSIYHWSMTSFLMTKEQPISFGETWIPQTYQRFESLSRG